MTARRREIIRFIAEYWKENWTSPSVREIAEAVGLASKATVAMHLEVCVREGLLERKRLTGRRVLYRPTHAALDRIIGGGIPGRG